MTGKSDWEGRTGRSWADEWRRTDRAFGALTDRLLAETRGIDFAQALDIGCGAGELTLALARGRPAAQVTGVDVSPQLLDAARSRAGNLANARFVEADAQVWQPERGTAPELIASRHGVMFFDDPAAAFRNLSATAAPEAHLAFSCFRRRAECPFFTEIDALLPGSDAPQSTGYAPGPFGFADNTFIRDTLSQSGWSDIAIEPYDFAMIAGAGDDPIEDALSYFQRIGPAAPVIKEADESERKRILHGLRDFAERRRDGSIVSARAAAWIVTARKAA